MNRLIAAKSILIVPVFVQTFALFRQLNLMFYEQKNTNRPMIVVANQNHIRQGGWYGCYYNDMDVSYPAISPDFHTASRLALCKAFIAKAVWDLPTTRDLLDAVRHRPTLRRLCSWETPAKVLSESTFSRAFTTFAEDQLPQRIQEAMVKAYPH
jgi:hypothetical protein